MRKVVIGLTGGACSGKTTACDTLRSVGAKIINADLLGHAAYEPGTSGFHSIVKEFGQDLVSSDGEIDRRTLGGIVFKSKADMKRLTDIVWPIIRDMAEQGIRSWKETGTEQVLVLEAAVLFEAKWNDLVDVVWSLEIPREVAISRLIERPSIDLSKAEAIVSSQISNAARQAGSNIVINTNRKKSETVEALLSEFSRLIEVYKK